MIWNRADGRVIRSLEPLERIMPFIMKMRNDAMTMYEEPIPCDGMDQYIKEKKEQGIQLDYMHILIAAVVRLLAIRPQLNRFVMHGRVYARPKIWVSFAVHPSLREGDVETTIKLCFEGTETILEIAEKINESIQKETVQRSEENGTDKLARTLTFIPTPALRWIVSILMWMDKHNMLPGFILDLSPFHTSFFVTNLKSLGINHVFHHIYNFGTTGLFFAMGKEKLKSVVRDGEIVQEKQMGFGLVSDERFCDGLYYARSLRKFRRFMMNPAMLEIPLDKKVEDIR